MDKLTKEGLVLNNDKGRLTVEVFRNGACGSCAANGNCAESKTTEIEVYTHEDIKKGDWVVIEGDASEVTKLTAKVYLIPVVMMFIGAILPSLFLTNTGLDINLMTLISAGVFLAISIIIVKAMDKKVEKENLMKVRKK